MKAKATTTTKHHHLEVLLPSCTHTSTIPLVCTPDIYVPCTVLRLVLRVGQACAWDVEEVCTHCCMHKRDVRQKRALYITQYSCMFDHALPTYHWRMVCPLKHTTRWPCECCHCWRCARRPCGCRGAGAVLQRCNAVFVAMRYENMNTIGEIKLAAKQISETRTGCVRTGQFIRQIIEPLQKHCNRCSVVRSDGLFVMIRAALMLTIKQYM